jgi:hypothetical protein
LYTKYFQMSRDELAIEMKKAGYTKYEELGWVIEERLQECINKGFIKSNGEDYMLTAEGASNSTMMYILGSYEHLGKYKAFSRGELNKNANKTKKRGDFIDDIFKEVV